MKNRIWGLVWGLFFIVAGLGFAGNAFGIWDFDLFFDGWWTLFIILPCAISLIQGGPRGGALVGLAVGVLLLLSAQDILPIRLVWKLLLPVGCLLIGLNILFKQVFGWRGGGHAGGGEADGGRFDGGNGGASPPSGDFGFCAVFSGHEERVTGRFEGASLTAVFGGGELDLREALIDRDVTIDATAVFGGIDLFLPRGVRVRVAATPIFGGVDNKAPDPTPEQVCPTVYVRATCIFGGVDIQ